MRFVFAGGGCDSSRGQLLLAEALKGTSYTATYVLFSCEGFPIGRYRKSRIE